MKKSLSLVLVLNVLTAMGYAQTNLDAEVDAELSKMYSATTQTVEAQPTAASTQAPVQAQPIYIVNQATPTVTSTSEAGAGAAAIAVQKQPTTIIEASPLTESRAEAIRKARQDAELSTEAQIVEKLERARLEDERRRAQLLFGDKLSGQGAENPAQPAATVQPAPQPQIIVVPTPVAPAPEKAEDEMVENEMKSALKAETILPVEPLAPVATKYFSGIVGVTQASDADHIKGNYSMGFTFGTRYDDTYAVEGSFIVSKYEVENINNIRWYGGYVDLFDVDQYSGNVALKYFFLKGMVRPVLGGLAQYSYRDFKWSDKNGTKPYNLSDSNSHAFDIGAIMGVEVQFSPTMSLGFDVRYLKNVAVNRNYSTSSLKYNSGAYTSPQKANDYQYGYRTPVEDEDHYMYGLSFQVGF